MMKKYILIAILFLYSFIEAQAQEEVKITNLDFNTENSDFGGTEYKYNQLIFASSKYKRSFIRRIWTPNDQPFLDLYVSKKNLNGKKEVKKFPKEINTKYHESSVAFSPDFKTMYFTRDRYIDGKLGETNSKGKVVLNLYKATNIDGEWTKIMLLPFNSHLYSTGHPSVSKDGQSLYFISDMPGSFGETDIYKVSILGNNKYSQPKNLGSIVNTTGKEMFPYIDSNNVLYFSSDGKPNTQGGLDVYAVNVQELGKVIHLKSPINSVSDDFAFKYNTSAKSGYISSNREGGKGSDDVYAFFGNINLDDSCVNLKGFVIDKQTNFHITEANVSLYNLNGTFIKHLSLDNIGRFEFKASCDDRNKYVVKVNKQEYIPVEVTSITSREPIKIALPKNMPKVKTITDNVNVKTRDDGKLIIDIGNIYFDTNKSFIRSDARARLDRLVRIMKEYPTIKVQIGSHTDNIGKAYNNMRLSERRANSTLNYVISRGISPNRIFGKGFGETLPVNRCRDGVKCTKDELQLNRRTEFIIISK